ncbi:MAG: serine hydrolase [Calothrix sp. C42_A2020_038]|nr:serine hydrolase [Calothrix sp. C42_A2020_038]
MKQNQHGNSNKQEKQVKLVSYFGQISNWYSSLFVNQIVIILGAVGIYTLTYNYIIPKTIALKSTSLADSAKLMSFSIKEVLNVSRISAISNSRNKMSNEINYNVLKSPTWRTNKRLDDIVNDIVALAKKQELPYQSLSVTLIDLNTETISGYQQHVTRYPASVVKLFWMVILEELLNLNQVENSNQVNDDVKSMIIKSDNDAASRIVDIITNSKSSVDELSDTKFTNWLKKRYQMNSFFQKAGYQEINISQKTFPFAEPVMNEPEGTELQLQNYQKNSNQISAYHAARMMYEIVTKSAVSFESSQKMLTLLQRDLHVSAWKNNPTPTEAFNPVENFMGESLSDQDIIFASKAGQTSTVRNEVAYVATRNGKFRYIIAVFGQDAKYSESTTIFPKISKLVFERMK